uniref:Cytochrome P450 n=1 Tax=Stomoxys calcitrans TaxID=35570 RepID=A0A1I8PUL0_STOCA
MHVIILIVISLAVWGYFIHASRKSRRDAVKNIDGPYNIPLLGPLHWAYGVTPQNIFRKALETKEKYGYMIKVWILNRLVVISADPEMNEQLLSSIQHIGKHQLYGVLHQWLGTGLLTSNGQKWHSRRKIITPTFHFKILEQFVEVFHQQSAVLVQCLASQADGKSAFDIYPHVCSATLDIIAETAMGTKVKAQTNGTMDYTAAVDEMTKVTAWRFFNTHLHSDIIFTILHPFKKMRMMKNLRIMHEFTRKVIKERRQTLEQSLAENSLETVQNEHNDVGSKRRMALLDVLLQSSINGQPLSDDDIREEVDTFMFEGHDTTATALAFTLYLLARHPRVQNKLLAEIHEACGADNSRPCTIMSLNEMKYLECVIKESLRLYPPVPMIARQIEEDFKYKHSSYGEGIIPAGTEMAIILFAMSENSPIFKNPAEFLPERHEEMNAGTSFHYIPFSAGPRNCIGQKFAMLELKVVLIHVIQAYELLPLGQSVEPMLGLVLRSQTGMQLGMKKRTN